MTDLAAAIDQVGADLVIVDANCWGAAVAGATSAWRFVMLVGIGVLVPVATPALGSVVVTTLE
jgi:hypothetical protein